MAIFVAVCAFLFMAEASLSTSIIGKAKVEDFLYWDQEFQCPPGSMLDTLAKVPIVGKHGKDYRFFGTCRPYHGPNCYRLCYWGPSCKAVSDHMKWPIGTAEVANYVAGMRSSYRGKLRDIELLCCVTPAAVFAAKCMYARWSQDDETSVSGYEALYEFGRERQKDNRYTAFRDLHIVRYEDNTMVFRFLICLTWPMMKWDCSPWDEKIPPYIKRAAVHAMVWPQLGNMAYGGYGYGLALGSINECLSSPCLCGGTCTDLVSAFQCTCPDGCSGTRCEIVTCPGATVMQDQPTKIDLQQLVTTISTDAAGCSTYCQNEATCMAYAFNGTQCLVSLSTEFICSEAKNAREVKCDSNDKKCGERRCKCLIPNVVDKEAQLRRVTEEALCSSPPHSPNQVLSGEDLRFCFIPAGNG